MPDEFLERHDVAPVVDEFLGTCLSAIESGGATAQIPEPVEFLRARGVEPPMGRLRFGHAIHDLGIEPRRPLCPDGSDHCVSKPKEVGGKQVWVWVCNCP